jgi:hypothetical protein
MKNSIHLNLLTAMLLLALFSAACKKDNGTDTLTSEPVHATGETYQGGIIAYILHAGDTGYDVNKQHGLIAAPADQNNGELTGWGGNGSIGVTGSAIGLGQANTSKIVNFDASVTYAAHVCNNLVLGGFDDWYLPSKDELLKLYQVKSSLHISDDRYWSSTEATAGAAVVIRFMDGVTINQTKTVTNKARAIRSF